MMRSFYNDTMYPISLTYCIRESTLSLGRVLDFYHGDPGSNHIRDVGFFSDYASSLSYEFSYSQEYKMFDLYKNTNDHFWFKFLRMTSFINPHFPI